MEATPTEITSIEIPWNLYEDKISCPLKIHLFFYLLSDTTIGVGVQSTFTAFNKSPGLCEVDQ